MQISPVSKTEQLITRGMAVNCQVEPIKPSPFRDSYKQLAIQEAMAKRERKANARAAARTKN